MTGDFTTFTIFAMTIIMSGLALWKPNLILAIMSTGFWAVLLYYVVNNPITGMPADSAGGNMIVMVCSVGIIAIPLITFMRMNGERKERISKMQKEGENEGRYYNTRGRAKDISELNGAEYEKFLADETRRRR